MWAYRIKTKQKKLCSNSAMQLLQCSLPHAAFVTFTTNYNLFPSQARYKEARDTQKRLLTPAHKYMFEILADRLSLELTAVEDFVLDAPSVSFPFETLVNSHYSTVSTVQHYLPHDCQKVYLSTMSCFLP